MRSTNAFHLPGLNTLRFYAALCVVLAHLDSQFDVPNPLTKAIAFFTLDAQSAVNFFFVLSGFLITLLLLRERATNGQISVRDFYARRGRRIWPLYYGMVFIGLLLLPWLFGESYPLAEPHPTQWLFVLLLLPNFAGLSAPLAHLWTIGIEEQFYAVWPWTARRDGILLRAIAGVLILKIALVSLGTFLFPPRMLALLMDLRYESMAIGAFAAFVYFKQAPIMKWLYHPLSQWLAAVLMLCFVVWTFPQSLRVVLVSSCSFAIIILNVATNPRAWLRLNHPWGERLGKISYGIYMVHFPVLFLCVFLIARLQLPQIPYIILLYALTIGATILAASLSYQYFELPIQRTRWRFRNERAKTESLHSATPDEVKLPG